jgi:hypothetical protein
MVFIFVAIFNVISRTGIGCVGRSGMRFGRGATVLFLREWFSWGFVVGVNL